MTTARTLYRVTVLLYAALAATASIAADGRSWSCGRSSRWRVDVLEDGGWREVETELVLTPDGRRNLHLVPDDVLAEYDGPSFWSRHADGKACANHVVKAASVRIPWRDGLRIRVRSAGKLGNCGDRPL